MSMVVGKEARAALLQEIESWADHSAPTLADAFADILDRCTDAPEVGGAEPVANLPAGPWTWSPQVGKPNGCHLAQVWDADGKSLVVVDSRDDPDEASAVAKLIAESRRSVAHPPEVVLPEGFPWDQSIRLIMSAMSREVAGNRCKSGDHEAEVALLSLARWLETAGQEDNNE